MRRSLFLPPCVMAVAALSGCPSSDDPADAALDAVTTDSTSDVGGDAAVDTVMTTDTTADADAGGADVDVETVESSCADTAQCQPGMVCDGGACRGCTQSADCRAAGYLASAVCNTSRGVCIDGCTDDDACAGALHGDSCQFRDLGDSARSCVTLCGVDRGDGVLTPDHTRCAVVDSAHDRHASLPICAVAHPGNTVHTCTYGYAGRACAVPEDGPTQRGWQRRVLTGGQARCNNGCPYVYYFRPAPAAAGADKWILFHKGGGGCHDDLTCAARWGYENSKMVARYNLAPSGGDNDAETASPKDDGIFARGRSDNFFTDWNQVYLPYCSSDSHVGNATRDDNGVGVDRRGRVNATETVADLLARTNPSLADATDVLVFGGSAGSAGARNNADLIARMIRAASAGSPTIKAAFDAAWTPSVTPGSYERDFGAALLAYQTSGDVPISDLYDPSCMAAHADDPFSGHVLCNDEFHVLTGKGLADVPYSAGAPSGETDDGHFTRHSDGDDTATDALFIFMDQYDGKSLERIAANTCVRNECADRDDCLAYGAAHECRMGLCMRRAASGCEPTACKGTDIADASAGLSGCFAPNSPSGQAYCLYESAVYDHVATDMGPARNARCSADGDCDPGEVCTTGICSLSSTGCFDNAACTEFGSTPGEYVCHSLNRICIKPQVSRAADCNEPLATYTADTEECAILPGCNTADPASCPGGYTCMARKDAPMAQVHSAVLRKELGALEDLRWVDPSSAAGRTRAIAFVPATLGHTSFNGPRFYNMRIDGISVAQLAGAWYAESSQARSLVAPSERIGWPLRVDSVAANSLALGFTPQLQVQPAGCAAALRIAVLTADDDTVLATWEVTPGGGSPQATQGASVNGERVKVALSLAPSSTCTSVVIDTTQAAAAGGPYVRLGLSRDTQDATVDVAMPPVVTIEASQPTVVYVSDDGATWVDPDMLPKQRVAGPVP